MADGTSVRELDVLLAQRRFDAVLERGLAAAARAPRSLDTWLLVARAAIALGRMRQAEHATGAALKLAPGDGRVELLRAVVEHRLARTDAAIERARRLAGRGSPYSTDALMVLAEALLHSGRRDELQALVSQGGMWDSEPRGQVAAARAIAHSDPAAAASRLEAIARGDGEAHVRRAAGFDAVRLLDAAGRFREAFDLACHLHATTGAPFDIGALVDDLSQQGALLARGKPWFQPCAPAVGGTAVVVGMPRSGTTLLEQMLDRHPLISGIGEYEGLQQLGNALVAGGLWPRDVGHLGTGPGAKLQSEYLDGARALARPGAACTFDKGLHAWRLLPAVAAVLPGAACIWITRDPRDAAISMFLSNFHPGSFGWTRTLEGIRTVIGLERDIVPRALGALGIAHEAIVYEDLVADPAADAQRCIVRFGLRMDAAVLSPEANARTVLTLSHDQVRRPISRASIGRWRNYEWAFDAGWSALADAHDARRARIS